MTFLVEHVTPGKIRNHSGYGVDRALRSALPFEVEVTGPIPRVDYRATCKCAHVYQLTDEAVQWLKKREMLKRELVGGPNPVVCDCMGRVVEEEAVSIRDFRQERRRRG